MIKLRVKVAGELRSVETRARHLEDLEAPLAAFAKLKRKEVQARFDSGGPGWPKPRDGGGAASGERDQAAKDAAVKQVADEMLRRKLTNDLRRAKRKFAALRGSAESVARRYAVLQEFERLAAGGAQRTEGFYQDRRLSKSVVGLRARHARAYAKASGKTLGRIAQSIRQKLTSHSVEIFSEVPWSRAHNEGLTVGEGVKLPEREFLEVTEDDVKLLVKLVDDHVNGG